MIDKSLAAVYIAAIEERIECEKIIAKLQDWLIRTMDNHVAEDSTSKTCTTNTRYNYTMDGLHHPSRFDPASYIYITYGFNDVDVTRDLYGRLLQIV